MEILRASETELPIFKTELPILGRQFQNERTVRYELVAAKIPEQVIREVLSEVRVDGAKSPAKLFTYKIQRYALTKQKS